MNGLGNIKKILLSGLQCLFWSGFEPGFASLSPDEDYKSQATLILITTDDESRQGQEFPVTTSPAYLGRAADNDIVLLESSISRSHAKIMCIKNQIYIQDYGSKFGTYLNGEKLRSKPVPLVYGDKIRLGVRVTLLLAPRNPGAAEEISRVEQPISSELNDETTMITPRDFEEL